MNFVIAEVELDARIELGKISEGTRLVVRRDENVMRIGLHENCGVLRLEDVRAVMQYIDQNVVTPGLSFVWRFSSCSAMCTEFAELLTRWEETGEPPLLSFIGFDLGVRRHTTRGMAAFTGYEITADFLDPSRARFAARNLARLARHALMHGGLSRDEAYEATDGAIVRLAWPGQGSLPKLVTVVFR